jgi:hypothetical protein
MHELQDAVDEPQSHAARATADQVRPGAAARGQQQASCVQQAALCGHVHAVAVCGSWLARCAASRDDESSC